MEGRRFDPAPAHKQRPQVSPRLACGFVLRHAPVSDRAGGGTTSSTTYPSVQSASLWGTNLLITLTLLTMIDLFGVGQVFWIYGLFNVAAFLFVWRRMPELTGHSLEDIEKHLQDETFRPADFRTT